MERREETRDSKAGGKEREARGEIGREATRFVNFTSVEFAIRPIGYEDDLRPYIELKGQTAWVNLIEHG